MRVKIGPYISWIGPYQIAEKLLFWKDPNTDAGADAIDAFGKWLAETKSGKDTLLTRFCSWIHDKSNRKIKVRIDEYDCWSADHTLALVISPTLKLFRDRIRSAPFVDDEDVPDDLKSTSAPPLTEEEKNTGHTDENWFKRWDWVVGEMSWAFEQSTRTDWESDFHSGKSDLQFVKIEGSENYEMITGPNDTFKIDIDGMKAHRERMTNGRRLFAKYYESLWS